MAFQANTTNGMLACIPLGTKGRVKLLKVNFSVLPKLIATLWMGCHSLLSRTAVSKNIDCNVSCLYFRGTALVTFPWLKRELGEDDD